MSIPHIVLGAGGHAKVVIDTLQVLSHVIIGIVDSNPMLMGDFRILNVQVLGGDHVISKFSPSEIKLAMGIGSVGTSDKREELYRKFKKQNYLFATITHPSAIIASDVILGEGTQVMAGVVIQPSCNIGTNCIINTRSTVDHDCTIGNHVHVAPGVTISGGVTIGDRVHIGTGATVIQGISIGSYSMIAAGTVVTRNVIAGTSVRGVPGREFK